MIYNVFPNLIITIENQSLEIKSKKDECNLAL
jgi:hypothetical protein